MVNSVIVFDEPFMHHIRGHSQSTSNLMEEGDLNVIMEGPPYVGMAAFVHAYVRMYMLLNLDLTGAL